MKNKQLKGFSLIECLVALFILGISSLLLVQAYSQLARVTAMNNRENISISQQMDTAEHKTDADADKITVSAQKNFVVTQRKYGNGTFQSLTTSDYTFKVDSYQVKGKEKTSTGYVDASSGSDADSMRYVYFK